jgi:hypothetical protein
MPRRSDAPISEIDLILANPLLAAARLNPEASPAKGPRGQAVARATIGLGSMCNVLRQGIASLFAPEPAQSADEFRTILIFSLGGLAISFQLAAQAKAADLDKVLASILLLSS